MDVFPTAYFGSTLYFRELLLSNDPWIEMHEHYIKQTCRSRCLILSSNGPQALSVPVIRKNGSKTPVFEVEVDYSTKWQKDHWKAIESTYASAPFFESYDREIKDLIFSGETNLIRFNNQITRSLLNFIDIDLEINYSEHYISIVDGCDFRKWDFEQEHNISKYTQVFQQPNGFTSNLSILDLLFAEGPLTRNFLLKNELTIGSN